MSGPLPFIPENVPADLRGRAQWVGWRYEGRGDKRTKVPYSAKTYKRASSTDPATWATFDLAVKYAQVAGLDGIMFALTEDDPYVVIDLDHCRDPETGELTERATEYVARVDSLTEVTPSDTGLHIWVRATLPPSGRKRGDVEMYERARFMTVTTHLLDGAPAEIKYRPDAVTAIHREVFGEERAPIVSDVTDVDRAIPALELGDEDVIRLAADSTHSGDRFRRLWDGDSSDYASGGNDGESEADAALFEMLAFFGGPDPEKIERIARRSHRVREKWDRQADYLKRSIAFVIQDKTRFYGDSARPVAPVGSDGASSCTCESCPHRAEEHRLRGLLFDRDDLVEHQQVVLREAFARLEQERELRALDRRQRMAEQRLRRCQNFSGGQKDAVIAFAQIAPAIANTHQTDTPIVTRDMVAGPIGAHPQSVGGNLKVFDLPGSPVRRIKKWVGNKLLTMYELGGRSAIEIIESMAEVAEHLDERPTKPSSRRCPNGCDAGVITVCAGCGTPVTGAAPDNRSETLVLHTGVDASVSVGTPGERNARVAVDELSERRARATQALQGLRDVDRWKRLEPARPDQPALWEPADDLPDDVSPDLVVEEPDWLLKRPPDDVGISPSMRAIVGGDG